MPNKNSIESCGCACHSHKLAKENGLEHDTVCCDNLNGTLEWRAVQREVKKGRVEELKKLNENLIKSGVEEKAEERIMLVIDDRLEELEG